MPTSRSIRNALIAAIKTIKIANNYAQDIEDANVFEAATPYQSMQQLDPAAYPRVFVYSEGADYADLPSNRIVKEEVFSVIAVFAKPATEADVAPTIATQVENFIDDFEVMVNRNKQLGNSDYVALKACADDLGAAATEAVVIFELSIQFRRNFN